MQMPFCSNLWDRSPAHAPENHVAINGTVVVSCHFGLSLPGKTTTLRLFSGTQMDPSTFLVHHPLLLLVVFILEFQLNCC